MEHPIIQIKNAITALLKGIDPDTDVFYEEIKGTEEKHGLDEPETYYFVDIIPNGNETVDRFFTDMGVLVDIAYHEKSESNTAYLIKGAEIDAVVRPVFSFGDRNITINDANMKVSDHVRFIKIVEGMDLYMDDIRETYEESYVGKIINDYDGKQMLVAAIGAYHKGLLGNVLDKSYDNVVAIDIDAQRTYLESRGMDTSEMDDIAVAKANTGTKVFIASNVKFVNAMEDLKMNVNM